jgi:hypothetical protein
MDCQKCQVLWEQYAQATNTHFSLLSKATLALIERDRGMLTELDSLKLATGKLRDRTRVDFKEHERNHHHEVAHASGVRTLSE